MRYKEAFLKAVDIAFVAWDSYLLNDTVTRSWAIDTRLRMRDKGERDDYGNLWRNDERRDQKVLLSSKQQNGIPL